MRNSGLKHYILLLSTVCLTTTQAGASSVDASLADKQAEKNSTEKKFIDAQVAGMVYADAPVAICIIDGNQSRFYSYGHVHTGLDKKPDENTLFRIASISKIFTGLLLAEMVQDRSVRLDDASEKYLPGVKLPKYEGIAFTLKDLATHTSGLPRRVSGNVALLKKPFQDQDLFDELSHTQLDSIPGSKFSYSNLGIAVLGEVLSARAHRPFERLLQERVCTPLKLLDTSADLPTDKVGRVAQCYDKGQQAPALYPNPAAGGLYSTSADLTHLLRAYLHPETTELKDALQLSYQPLTDYPQGKMAMCWHIDPPTQVVFKDGALPGWKSFVGFIPGANKAVVVLAACTRFKARQLGLALLKQPAGYKPAAPEAEAED